MESLTNYAQRLIDLFTLCTEALDNTATGDTDPEALDEAYANYDEAIEEVAALIDVAPWDLESVVYDAYHYGKSAADVAAYLEKETS